MPKVNSKNQRGGNTLCQFEIKPGFNSPLAKFLSLASGLNPENGTQMTDPVTPELKKAVVDALHAEISAGKVLVAGTKLQPFGEGKTASGDPIYFPTGKEYPDAFEQALELFFDRNGSMKPTPDDDALMRYLNGKFPDGGSSGAAGAEAAVGPDAVPPSLGAQVQGKNGGAMIGGRRKAPKKSSKKASAKKSSKKSSAKMVGGAKKKSSKKSSKKASAKKSSKKSSAKMVGGAKKKSSKKSSKKASAKKSSKKSSVKMVGGAKKKAGSKKAGSKKAGSKKAGSKKAGSKKRATKN